jgi:hypothetical protein
MYPIDARQLISRATLGSNALDPTLPHRPSRRLRVRRAGRDRAGAPSTRAVGRTWRRLGRSGVRISSCGS